MALSKTPEYLPSIQNLSNLRTALDVLREVKNDAKLKPPSRGFANKKRSPERGFDKRRTKVKKFASCSAKPMQLKAWLAELMQTMNRTQRLIILLMLLLVATSCLFPPMEWTEVARDPGGLGYVVTNGVYSDMPARILRRGWGYIRYSDDQSCGTFSQQNGQ